MDRNAFDGLTKLLAGSPTRRAALGALLGGGLAGVLGTDAARKDRNKKRQNRKDRKKGKGTAQVSAQAADCLNPGPSSNMNQCDFSGSDFSGDDLSGSSMVGTNFTNAELEETDLSSSNMKNAVFRGANLCGADLSSSQLRNADFRGFAPLGGPTDLTLADLASSGCAGIQTNQFTIICGTTWCDGSVRNDDCPGGVPSDFCCLPCGPGEQCVDNECVAVCDEPFVSRETDCACLARADGAGFACIQELQVAACSAANPSCPVGAVCINSPCSGGVTACAQTCQSPAPCDCAAAPATCTVPDFVKCGDFGSAARRAGAARSGIRLTP